jgi:hypothetical protein
MKNISEVWREARKQFDLSLMPPALEIIDLNKRLEFHNDYKRLVGRCGRASMNALLNFYLIEQVIQDRKGTEALPKITILGHNNTSEIIARLVEEGLADFYLSKKPVSPTAIITNNNDKPVSITSFHPNTITQKSKEDGIPNMFAPEVIKFQSLRENATLIAPTEIRSVFATIDAQYNSPSSQAAR